MMHLLLKYKIIFILLFISSITFPQVKDSINVKNRELKRIRAEITQLENELKSKSLKEKESLQTLEIINRKNLLISKLINNLIAEENEKEKLIEKVEQNSKFIEENIQNLKDQYSRYVVWLYKHQGINFWKFIFDAESFNQMLVRYQYFKYISNKNKNLLDKLNYNKGQLNNLKDTLEIQRKEKELLANQKLKEKNELEKIEKEKRDLISILKHDKKIIAKEITSKRQAEIVIKNLIANLIERDRKNKIKKFENNQYKNLSQSFDYKSLQSFVELKGRLGWPIKEGKIIRPFGENKNEKLNTITLNYGIDILSKIKSNVLAVAEGIVSAIDWIPGYGSIVILTHRDDFRTVYGHISNIAVKEGEKLKAGSVLGQVNESLEGNILHFEIWNERNYQNPEIWLSRR
ncbi:MAG: peptidoglycan DD-metalloendopeptidase family protein [Stygiobacter sp.]|uniref:Peptidoglycan DD-metalloendopeptidase family protein n=1 Tax=Stygiobacter electus TaxID=3032292 RepID=A0AAE3TBY2_9BACT|nr:peptidoglycan DD-metalloendopeptidase family protein [Stygiobacter electus]MDF1611833.1 peptidoglycan DD-metalloendopeptidase family protein [Stygiobacter electus]